MIVNHAQRAHNHNFESDFIIRSRLNTDIYKPLMLQEIWRHHRDVPVTFGLINRTKTVKLGEEIDETELRRQFDHARGVPLQKSEEIWLLGNTFYSVRGIFEPAFVKDFRELQLPDYDLRKVDGQIELTFSGSWFEVTMWELYALSIINELRTRRGLATMNEFELDIFYARAKTKLWSKIERLRGIPGLRIADFGTRRRHSHLWHEYVVQAMKELGASFTGTSNAYLAYKHDLEAIGTNAHELPMVMGVLARLGKLGDITLKQSQYEVLRLWSETYGGALLVFLPDTFGTTQFLKDAPNWVADWTGLRADSKDPYAAGDEYIAWLESRGVDPRTKLLLLSDGLDVDDIIKLHAYFGGRIQEGYTVDDFKSAADFLDPEKWVHEPRIRVAFGWGTLLTNDFRGCHPRGLNVFDPISLVCKVQAAYGHPAVKLSDNYTKATGDIAEIAVYRETFGTDGAANAPVTV